MLTYVGVCELRRLEQQEPDVELHLLLHPVSLLARQRRHFAHRAHLRLLLCVCRGLEGRQGNLNYR